MAELLGTVSSAAGLAGLAMQLLETGKKLKAFYDDVKDAPEDLKHVQERMSTLAMLLQVTQSSENLSQLHKNSPQFEQCIASSQAAAKEVKQFVNKLEIGIAKNKRWGAVKSVLKKDDFAKLDKRLEKATSLLHLYCSLHGIELFQSIFQAVQGLQVLIQMPQSVNVTDSTISAPALDQLSPTSVSQSSLSEQDESDVQEIPRIFDDDHFRTSAILRKKKKKTRLRLPLYFVNKIWEIEYCRSISGWDVTLRARRVIPCDSAIFQLAEKADLEGVKALLLNNQASIFDEDKYGRNAISLCLEGIYEERMLKFCQFFIDQGLESDSVNHDWNGLTTLDLPILHDIHRRILPYLTEPTILQWLNCCGQPDIIHDLALRLDPPLHTYTLKDRLRLILGSLETYGYGTSRVTDAFVTRLGCELTNEAVLHIVLAEDPSFLCRIILIFGIAFSVGDKKARRRLIDLFKAATETGLTYWMYHTSYGSMLMYLFVEGTFALNFVQPPGQTPGAVPRNSLRMWEDPNLWETMVYCQRLVNSAIQSWLDCLYVAGVKLVDYGREVCTSLSTRQNMPDLLPSHVPDGWEFTEVTGLELHSYTVESFSWGGLLYPFEHCKIITFRSGPHPEDWIPDFSWKLSDNHIWESASRGFWEMLDQHQQPWQQIPGAWQSEWDTCNEIDHIRWPSYYTSRKYRRRGLPNRGWRKATAKSLAQEDSTTNIPTSRKRLVHKHQERLQHGAIRMAIEEEWWKDGAAHVARYFRADEIEAYREAAYQ